MYKEVEFESREVLIDTKTWIVRRQGAILQIVDPEGRERHRSVNPLTMAAHFAMALSQLPFESNPVIDETLRKQAERRLNGNSWHEGAESGATFDTEAVTTEELTLRLQRVDPVFGEDTHVIKEATKRLSAYVNTTQLDQWRQYYQLDEKMTRLLDHVKKAWPVEEVINPRQRRNFDKLQRFKEKTHHILDTMGVPQFLGVECRISARLEWLQKHSSESGEND